MKTPTIGQLNRMLKICSQSDVADKGQLCLTRTGVRDVFARISPLSMGATWTASGYNAEDKPTHEITTRAFPDLEISHTAWFHESRSMSADRWYKVVDAKEREDGQWWVFKVRVDARSDASQPAEKDQCETARDLGLARRSEVRL